MTKTIDRPHLSRPFDARDICKGDMGNYDSTIGGPCCARGWDWWIDNRLGRDHPKARAFNREIRKINDDDVAHWNDTTDPAIVAAELNRIARKVGLLP